MWPYLYKYNQSQYKVYFLLFFAKSNICKQKFNAKFDKFPNDREIISCFFYIQKKIRNTFLILYFHKFYMNDNANLRKILTWDILYSLYFKKRDNLQFYVCLFAHWAVSFKQLTHVAFNLPLRTEVVSLNDTAFNLETCF